MGTFNTSVYSLSNTAKYYGQVTYEVEQLSGGRQFKVTINGVRVYCNQRYNFYSNVSTWIANDSSGSGAVSGGGMRANGIPAESVTGWSPSSGVSHSGDCSKIFYYNSDGSVPPVWVYGRFWNEYGVTYSGVKKYPDVSGLVDISSTIPKGTPLNIDLNLTYTAYWGLPQGYDANTICWFVSSNQTMDQWLYSLDKGSWVEYSTTQSTETRGRIVISSAKHTIQIKARSKSTGNYGYSNIWEVDCTKPDLSSLSLVVGADSSPNNGVLSGIPIGVTMSSTSSGVTIDNTIVSGIDANSTRKYTFVATRNDNTLITNSIELTPIVIRPNLFVEANSEGLNCNIKVEAGNYASITKPSDLTFIIYLNNEEYTLWWEGTPTIVNNIFQGIAKGITNSIGESVSFIPNQTYSGYVQGHNSKGLNTYKVYFDFKIQGCTRIFLNGKWQAASTYIRTEQTETNQSSWSLVIPYVCVQTDAEGKNPVWKMCI